MFIKKINIYQVNICIVKANLSFYRKIHTCTWDKKTPKNGTAYNLGKNKKKKYQKYNVSYKS